MTSAGPPWLLWASPSDFTRRLCCLSARLFVGSRKRSAGRGRGGAQQMVRVKLAGAVMVNNTVLKTNPSSRGTPPSRGGVTPVSSLLAVQRVGREQATRIPNDWRRHLISGRGAQARVRSLVTAARDLRSQRS